MKADDDKLAFTVTLPRPEKKEDQDTVEHDFLKFAYSKRPEVDVEAEVIKGPERWTLRASFTDPKAALSFAMCFPGGLESIQEEVLRHEERKAAKTGK
jgi:hypothetical protein